MSDEGSHRRRLGPHRALERHRATNDTPTEAPSAIDEVLVNGRIVMDHGMHRRSTGRVHYGPGRPWSRVHAGSPR